MAALKGRPTYEKAGPTNSDDEARSD
jgi:hypothetical protein